MAGEISKITLLDEGNTYSLKDITARTTAEEAKNLAQSNKLTMDWAEFN